MVGFRGAPGPGVRSRRGSDLDEAMAKRYDAQYEPERKQTWLKTKCPPHKNRPSAISARGEDDHKVNRLERYCEREGVAAQNVHARSPRACQKLRSRSSRLFHREQRDQF